jgi:membrane-bound metal-dependent hydrolase YbcI (DUF457 family)
MDIVTHALMGVAVAGPCLVSAPSASAGFILGSVLPDIDAFSRVFGKRCFLTWHQTFTHSAGAMLVVVAAAMVGTLVDYEISYLLLGISAGMLFHSLLDFTNTFGVKLWYPFHSKRVCLEWVFFIDSIVIGLTILALTVLAWSMTTLTGPSIWQSILYLVSLAIYFGFKGWLRKRALRQMNPKVLSLIPSAFWPWRFMGYRRENEKNVQLIDYNALRRSIENMVQVPILDDRWQDVLNASKYFQTMKQLSTGYHVVEERKQSDGGFLIRCRDLRTRNFGTTFGELEVYINSQGEIISQTLKV